MMQREIMDSNENDLQKAARRDINVYDYVQTLVKWRRFLALNIGIIILIVAVFAFLAPNRFRSTASILPPKQEGGVGSALSQLTKDILPSNMLGKLSSGQSAYNYLAILNSRTAKEAVVKKFDLAKVYNTKQGSIESAIRELEDYCTFDIGENGDITVSVTDTDPNRAAEMTNYFVEQLNTISVQLSTQEARNNRIFLEKRYKQAQDEMRLVEDSLKEFQQRYGIYSMPEQTKAAIEEAAQLKAQVSVAEVELGILRQSLGGDNAQARLKETEIRELNSKLRVMKYGSGNPSERDAELFVPFKDVPELGIKYLRLYREFEIQTRIMQLVIPMYEQARVDEQKTTPVVLVLDAGVPAEKKDGPRRTLIILAAFIMGFFVFGTFVYLMEAILTRPEPATAVEKRLRNGAMRVARRFGVRI
jgi:uncharacterized protein involved in exopolysaccharide biosynthesis